MFASRVRPLSQSSPHGKIRLATPRAANLLREALANSGIRHQTGVRNLDDDRPFEFAVPGQVRVPIPPLSRIFSIS